MSKSKGNGVDPMDLIDMYGADAMRFNLLTLCTTNQDVKFDADIDKKTKALKVPPAPNRPAPSSPRSGMRAGSCL